MLAGLNTFSLPGWKLHQTEKFLTSLNTHLEFTEHPYQQYPKPPVRFNSEEAALIDGEIQQLLNKGVLEETDPSYGQYVSTIFLRKKKNGSYRLILNLKGLNASIEYQHFKM